LWRRSKMSRSNTPRNHTFRDAPLTKGVLELEGEVVSDYLHVGSGIVDVVLTSDVGDLTDMIERILKGESLTSFASLNSMFSRPAHLLSRVGDRVVIPGSTIKGMVRTRLELSIPNACYIVDMQSRDYSQRYREIFKPDQRKRADRFPQVCPVCDLLGNAGLASRVEFSDFTLGGDWIDFVSIGSESYEVVKKGGKFSGRVTFKVKSPEELGMILWGFGIRSGGNKVVLLGRFKFQDRRFGRVKFTVKSLRVQGGKPMTQQDSLNSFVRAYSPRDFKEDW